MQILEKARGWQEVLNRFTTVHIPVMNRFGARFMVLLIDFDGRKDRLNKVMAAIPERLKERVFVLGAWNEPEELRQKLGSYETIGLAMAKDCRDDIQETWAHDLLCHDAGELDRVREHIRPLLFPTIS